MADTSSSIASTVSARCPRCGYDQRGAVESWADACPMNGVCTECGLEFEWRELLNPAYGQPRWCVEYVERWYRVPLGIAGTMLLTLRPWRFWSDLRMTHHPRWRPFVWMHIGLLIGVYFVFIATLGFTAATDGVWTSGFPTSVTRWEAVSRTMLFPLSTASPGVWSGTGRSASVNMPLLSPREYSRSLFSFLKYALMNAMPAYLAYLLLCALGFLVLPQSRRIAKVRWIHVYRICAYSTFQIWLLVYTLILASGIMLAQIEYAYAVLVLFVSFFIGLFIFQIFWWSLATSRYLKMRHSWGVGLAVCVMAFLGSMMLVGIVGALIRV